ncbi:MAG: M56 family metallopeptidase [Bryobacteraceae bacterium]
MISHYTFRLVCLSFSTFFLVHLLAGVAIGFLTPAIVRFFSQCKSGTAARALFFLRMLPVAAAMFAVAVFCIPSYLRFEPEVDEEVIGFFCLAAAVLCVWAFLAALLRGFRAAYLSNEWLKLCRRKGTESGTGSPTTILLDEPVPMLALAGIIRPSIVISRGLMRALSRSELAAAMRHERAHHEASDNLKRLLMALTPSLLPGWHGLLPLELAWHRFTEWAADDRAAAGPPGWSLSLASALVRVGRIGAPSLESAVASSFLDTDRELPARVDRLLRPASNGLRPGILGATVGITCITVAYRLYLVVPGSPLESFHRFLEQLID